MPIVTGEMLGNGNLTGAAHGATVSLIFDHSDPGGGPRLHRHPYDETWIVQEGNVTFQAGNARLHATPGDILIVPPDTPHKYQRRPRAVGDGLHPRQPEVRHRMA